MTTSYWFASYALDRQVSLSSSMSIEIGLFFLFDFLLYHYSNFRYYKLLLCYGKLKKNRENEKIKKMYPNNHGKYYEQQS